MKLKFSVFTQWCKFYCKGVMFFPPQKMPLEKLMRQYAQQSGEAYEKLTFYFDGEVVKPSDTAERLDMDEDDCLDVTST